MIRSIFLYLDRTFVLQTNGYLSLWDLGLAIFRENLLFNPAIKELTITDILAQIDKERYLTSFKYPNVKHIKLIETEIKYRKTC